MPLHGPLAEDEPGGDRLVRLAGRHEAQHLQLARGEPVGVVAVQVAPASRPWRRPAPPSSANASRAASRSSSAPSSSPSVRQASAVSTRTRAISGTPSSWNVCSERRSGTSADRGRPRPARPRPPPAGRSRQAVRSRSRWRRRPASAGLAGSPTSPASSMISTRRQERQPLDRLDGFGAGAPDRGDRHTEPALRDPQQPSRAVAHASSGSPLGRPPRPRRWPRTAHLRLPVAGLPAAPGPCRGQSAPARGRLRQGLTPGAVHLYDLGPVEQATSRERHHLGLLLAPVSAVVHSRARRSACASRQPSMTLQYMSPVIGDSCPLLTATITSSSSPSPSGIRRARRAPAPAREPPWPW